MVNSIIWPQPNRTSFQLLKKDKTEETKIYKQAATEGSCSNDLLTHPKGENLTLGDIHEFHTSSSNWLQRIFIQDLKTILIFIIMLIYFFWASENGGIYISVIP